MQGSDFETIFEALNRAGVRYLVVGGVVAEPFDFARAEAGALRADLGGLVVPVAALDDLLAMKRSAARPKDLEDVRALEALGGGSGSG
jgi:predicted nucleotidyltransferase